MSILEKSLKMLEQYPLCDHCLGRQFAMLGHGVENDERGKAIKLALMLEAHGLALVQTKKGVENLKTLATNGFLKTATETLEKLGKRISGKEFARICFLCENRFEGLNDFAKAALEKLKDYEYNSFLVGIELPISVEEREDEFKARLDASYGENMRNEFGREIGKKLTESSGKTVDYKKPHVVVLINPFTEDIRLQINPLYISGYYRKLVRGIPQSRWFCSNCRGKGCEKCNWSGKMYPESVEELIEKPLLELTNGSHASFHASGREDIDARMLGKGRPFVVEVANPKRRFLDLEELQKTVNANAEEKIEVSDFKFADKSIVRKLKRAESSQKEYRVFVEFENNVTVKDLQQLEEKLTNAMVEQKTPIRVLHRRANLTREKYIYEVKVKKLSPKKVQMKIRCQGGLYVKELVTGDEGRTVPNVSDILGNRAKPSKLDVLNVLMEE